MKFTAQKWLIAGLAAALGWAMSGPVTAQAPVQNPAPSDPGYSAAVRYPDSGFSFMHHSSTAAEGAYRGAASYIRALGAANLDNSLAAMNYQEAYRRSLENTLKYAETYYQRRDLWFDYQEEHRRKPLTMEGYQKLAAAAGADRLSADQYDADTGKIRWPDLLQAEVLKPYREEIDKTLAARSGAETGLGSRTYEVVRQMTAEMQSVLDRHRQDLPSHLYVHASKFLESVLFESRFGSPVAADEGAGAEGAKVLPVSEKPAAAAPAAEDA